MKKMLSAVCLLTFLSCGSSVSPGSGPGFPSTMTAADLFVLATNNVYIPEALNSDESFVNGTADCTLGGKAAAEHAETSDGNTADGILKYTDCKAQVGTDNFELTHNGTIHLYFVVHGTNKETVYFTEQVSFSGDIGFAADCEVTSDITSTHQTVTGSCTYTDSEGKVLSIDAQEIEDILNS